MQSYTTNLDDHHIPDLISEVNLSSLCTFKLHTFDILVCVSWWKQFSTKKKKNLKEKNV